MQAWRRCRTATAIINSSVDPLAVRSRRHHNAMRAAGIFRRRFIPLGAAAMIASFPTCTLGFTANIAGCASSSCLSRVSRIHVVSSRMRPASSSMRPSNIFGLQAFKHPRQSDVPAWARARFSSHNRYNTRLLSTKTGAQGAETAVSDSEQQIGDKSNSRPKAESKSGGGGRSKKKGGGAPAEDAPVAELRAVS